MKVKSSANIFYVSLMAATLILEGGCGRKDIDKVGDAQACLDSSTQATVSQCLDMVAGIESTQAYVVRCAAGFIAEWTDLPTKLSNASDQMKNGSTTASLAAMKVLSFSSTTTADANLANCQKSESKGLMLLSSISSMATHLSTSCSTDPIDPTCVSNAANDPVISSEVGKAAVVAYDSNCTGGQNTNSQFCNQFQTASNNAGGTSNSAEFGKQLLLILGTP
jgi:hypothetical protein